MIIIGATILIADPILERVSANWKNRVDIIQNNRKWMLYSLIALGMVLTVNPFVHNSAGERTYVQDPIVGTEKIIFEPGYTWGGFFARTETYPDVMSTAFDANNTVAIRFNDATQASAQANVR